MNIVHQERYRQQSKGE
jgi:hypothetical protein